MNTITFELTAEHITLLRNSRIVWHQQSTIKGFTQCPYAPYKSISIVRDILKLIGHKLPKRGAISKADKSRAIRLHKELKFALQVILEYQTFTPGKYLIIV